MKKILSIILVAAMLMASSAFAANSKKFSVKTTATCSDYNHVGKNWSKVFYINGKKISANSKITLRIGDTVTVKCKMTEKDSSPDIGTKSASHKVTSKDLKSGFTIKVNVTVKEDKGRYSGYKCIWKAQFKFK